MRKYILKSLLPELQGKLILDLGCGNGSITLDLVNQNHVTFVDLSSKMLEIVSNSIPVESQVNADIIQSSIEEYKPESKFDIVVCFGVLAHVDDIYVSLTKILDLVNPDGVIYLQFTDWDNQMVKLLALKQLFKKKVKYKTNRTKISDIQSFINKNNHTISKSINYFPVLPFMSFLSIKKRFNILKYLLNSSVSKYGSEKILEIK